ncbi:MAG: pentapeptide repeat-containing protein [Candidatus Margulisiibacteriota bacterium]
MISKDTFNVAMFAHPAQPRCFNYDIFERDEFFILNAEGLVRRTGQGQDGAMGEIACVAQATAITTGRLADYQYFNSIYGDYHSQVADAIRSLMAGDVASWNSFGQEIRALERPYYYPIQLIDLSGAHFDGLDLHGVDLSRTVLDWATFENVNLDDADVSTWEHLRVGIEFRGISQNDETKLGIV